MKAWKVTFCEEETAYVLADTKAEAKKLAFDQYPGDQWDTIWVDMRVVRQPVIDGDELSYKLLVQHGLMYTLCQGCYAMIKQTTSGQVWRDEWTPYCSHDCRERHETVEMLMLYESMNWDPGWEKRVIHLSTEY